MAINDVSTLETAEQQLIADFYNSVFHLDWFWILRRMHCHYADMKDQDILSPTAAIYG
jgi:hypothetical protein